MVYLHSLGPASTATGEDDVATPQFIGVLQGGWFFGHGLVVGGRVVRDVHDTVQRDGGALLEVRGVLLEVRGVRQAC